MTGEMCIAFVSCMDGHGIATGTNMSQHNIWQCDFQFLSSFFKFIFKLLKFYFSNALEREHKAIKRHLLCFPLEKSFGGIYFKEEIVQLLLILFGWLLPWRAFFFEVTAA